MFDFIKQIFKKKPTPQKLRVTGEYQAEFAYDGSPFISCQELELSLQGMVGKPLIDEDGETIGYVKKAWVEGNKICTTVEKCK